jgi:hypothetical protein
MCFNHVASFIVNANRKTRMASGSHIILVKRSFRAMVIWSSIFTLVTATDVAKAGPFRDFFRALRSAIAHPNEKPRSAHRADLEAQGLGCPKSNYWKHRSVESHYAYDCYGANRVKYWEIIADNLKKRGWSLGYVSAIDSNGRTIFVADAHRGDGQRFVVQADDKLTAFIELEFAARAASHKNQTALSHPASRQLPSHC